MVIINGDINIAQNNHDNYFGHYRAALVKCINQPIYVSYFILCGYFIVARVI